MRCAKCGSDNRDGRKFCADCGTPIAAKCPQCGASNEPGERFECGTPLAGSITTAPADLTLVNTASPEIRITLRQPQVSATLDGERKTVTALFADIKGSTELMEDLDPEEARAIVDPGLRFKESNPLCAVYLRSSLLKLFRINPTVPTGFAMRLQYQGGFRGAPP